MARDDHVDGAIEPGDDVDDLAGDGRAGLAAALMDEHDDRVHLLAGELRDRPVDRLRLVEEADPRDARGRDDRGRRPENGADEADPDAVDDLHDVRREDVRAGDRVDDVRADRRVPSAAPGIVEKRAPRVVAAAEEALELDESLVELVVPDRRHEVAARVLLPVVAMLVREEVEERDGRLVLEQRGRGRRRADVIPGVDDDRPILLARLGGQKVRGEDARAADVAVRHPAARGELPVEVVDRQDLHLDARARGDVRVLPAHAACSFPAHALISEVRREAALVRQGRDRKRTDERGRDATCRHGTSGWSGEERARS